MALRIYWSVKQSEENNFKKKRPKYFIFNAFLPKVIRFSR